MNVWDLVGSASSWRVAAAVLAALTLFTVTIALRAYGDRLEPAWRLVLRAVTVQQAVLTYAAISRAHARPSTLPARVDPPLVLIVLSGVALLVCVVGVFAGRRDSDSDESTTR